MTAAPIDLNKPSLFVFSVSTQINYGDLVISLAQEKFCQEFLPEYNYVEILDYQIKSGLRGVKSMIKDNDVIAISGGGNMGNLYPESERDRQEILKTFPNNKIVNFPQS